AQIGIALTTLAFDIGVLLLLREIAPRKRGRFITTLYWLSPITLYIGYWHGQLDVFPAFLLIASFFELSRKNFGASAFMLGLAAAAKLSMMAAAPIVAIHLIGSSRLRAKAPLYFGVLLATLAVSLAPLAFMSGFREMVLGTPELQKSIAIAIPY